MGLVSLFMVGNAIHIAAAHERFTAVPMVEIDRQIRIALSKEPPEGTTVAFQNLSANLLLPGVTSYGSLLPSAFGNFVAEDVVRERIFLYCKFLGFDEKQFMEFMSQSPFFQNLNSYSDKIITMGPTNIEKGLGWWLLNHKLRLDSNSIDDYYNQLKSDYIKFNVHEALQRIPVSTVVLSGAVPEVLQSYKRQVVGDYIVVRLTEKYK
jgi:hypothetical protein